MDALRLYTEKADAYVSFASSFSHQAGIAAVLAAEGLLRPDLNVLDAGCGTGFASFALLDALRLRGLRPKRHQAFDLTPAMLDRFAAKLRGARVADVEVRQADILDPAALPSAWTGYDLIVCVSMLEYVPRSRLAEAIRHLRQRLAPGGHLLLVITRRNLITWFAIERPWEAERYRQSELAAAMEAAGCCDVRFTTYPWRYVCLTVSNHIAIAREPAA